MSGKDRFNGFSPAARIGAALLMTAGPFLLVDRRPAVASISSQIVTVDGPEQSLTYFTARYNLPYRDVMGCNPTLDPANYLPVGTQVKLPPCDNLGASSGSSAARSETSAPVQAPQPPNYSAPVQRAELRGGQQYTVRKGDSLNKIARQLGVTTAALAEANGITNMDKIAVGAVLNIPSLQGTRQINPPPAQKPYAIPTEAPVYPPTPVVQPRLTQVPPPYNSLIKADKEAWQEAIPGVTYWGYDPYSELNKRNYFYLGDVKVCGQRKGGFLGIGSNSWDCSVVSVKGLIHATFWDKYFQAKRPFAPMVPAMKDVEVDGLTVRDMYDFDKFVPEFCPPVYPPDKLNPPVGYCWRQISPEDKVHACEWTPELTTSVYEWPLCRR